MTNPDDRVRPVAVLLSRPRITRTGQGVRPWRVMMTWASFRTRTHVDFATHAQCFAWLNGIASSFDIRIRIDDTTGSAT